MNRQSRIALTISYPADLFLYWIAIVAAPSLSQPILLIHHLRSILQVRIPEADVSCGVF